MQDNLIVMATAVVLALAIFISTSDAQRIHPRPPDNPPSRFGSSSACGPCQDNSNFSYVFVLRGSNDNSSYLFIDLTSPNGCCDVVAKYGANPLDIQVNHCVNTTKDPIIEIQSYVQINALVGVTSIEEGSNLTLQVRGHDPTEKSRYQMHLERYNSTSIFNKYALAFVPHNATDAGDKYYVIPEGEGDVATLTLRKNPEVDKFVFKFQRTAIP